VGPDGTLKNFIEKGVFSAFRNIFNWRGFKRWTENSYQIIRDLHSLKHHDVFALFSYFAIVFSFIIISTDNWFPYCAMALSIASVWVTWYDIKLKLELLPSSDTFLLGMGSERDCQSKYFRKDLYWLYVWLGLAHVMKHKLIGWA